MSYISLICATKGRQEELANLLQSLCSQEYKLFEVIVVDQNDEGMLDGIIDSYSEHIKIIHVRWHGKGASGARNYGLQFAQGDIIGFPDDDCTYPGNFLIKIVSFLSKDTIDVVCGKCIDFATQQDSAGRYDRVNCRLTIMNLWTKHILVAMFFKKEVIDFTGGFDEELGVGNYFGSGEETDLLLRSIYGGFNCCFDSGLFAYHPDPPKDNSQKSLHRAYSYGLGWGALHKKHMSIINNKTLVLVYGYSLLRSVGGILLSIVSGDWMKAHYYINSLKGRIVGWWSYPLAISEVEKNI